MTEMLWLALIAGVLFPAGVVAIRASNTRRWQDTSVVYTLRFPLQVEHSAVTNFIAGLAGLVAPRWHRPTSVRAVVIEVTATEDGISHRLITSRSLAPIVTAQLRASMPSVRVEQEAPGRGPSPDHATELGLSDSTRPLRIDQPEAIARGLLSGLFPLQGQEEAVTLQYVLSPIGPLPAASRSDAGSATLVPLIKGVPARVPNPEEIKARRDKQAHPLFAAAIRVGVGAQDRSRQRQLMQRVLASFHLANAPGAHLFRRAGASRAIAERIARRSLPLLNYPISLNAAELTGLVAFPLGKAALPGLKLGGCRLLPPAPEIPSHGRVLARANFPGAERPLALSVAASMRHLHVCGPTGVGKSTLLLNLMSQDIASGRGMALLDPKGDLVDDLLDRVPLDRAADVIVLDPSDEGRPVGFNLLAGASESSELLVDQLVGIFHRLYQAFWGPRTDDILRSALLTLVTEPGMTLCEVPLLLTDPSFRRRLVGRLDDPVGLGPFWAWYEGMSDAERAAAIGPVMNKLRSFFLRRRIRNVIGQTDGRLDLDHVIAGNKVLLVNLSKGRLGEEASALLGSLVMARLWQSIQKRAGLPQADRSPFFAYIDEAQDFLNLPSDLADVLVQARSAGCSLTLSHQHLAQLPLALRTAVLANAGSRVIFQTSAADARVFAKELSPHLEAQDLQGLDRFEVVAKLAVDSGVAAPVTGIALPPSLPLGHASTIRETSRSQWGRDRNAVEADIFKRHGERPGPGPIGRQRRTS